MEVKHFFVTTDYCDTALLPVDGLAVGDSAIVTYNGSALKIVDLENTLAQGAETMAAGTEYMLMVKDADGNLLTSEPFTLADITNAVRHTYSAGTKQVITFTPVVPVARLAGDSCSIKLINNTSRQAVVPTHSIEVVDETGAMTVAAMIDAFKLRIDALGLNATVADNNTNFTITFDNPDETWEAIDTSSDWTVTIANTTPNVPSRGTAAKVAEMEYKYLTYRGMSNFTKLPQVKPTSSVSSAVNYDIYVFTISKALAQRFNSLPGVVREYDIVIAATANATTAASLLYAAATA